MSQLCREPDLWPLMPQLTTQVLKEVWRTSCFLLLLNCPLFLHLCNYTSPLNLSLPMQNKDSCKYSSQSYSKNDVYLAWFVQCCTEIQHNASRIITSSLWILSDLFTSYESLRHLLQCLVSVWKWHCCPVNLPYLSQINPDSRLHPLQPNCFLFLVLRLFCVPRAALNGWLQELELIHPQYLFSPSASILQWSANDKIWKLVKVFLIFAKILSKIVAWFILYSSDISIWRNNITNLENRSALDGIEKQYNDILTDMEFKIIR